jgi:hypothetical protein
MSEQFVGPHYASLTKADPHELSGMWIGFNPSPSAEPFQVQFERLFRDIVYLLNRHGMNIVETHNHISGTCYRLGSCNKFSVWFVRTSAGVRMMANSDRLGNGYRDGFSDRDFIHALSERLKAFVTHPNDLSLLDIATLGPHPLSLPVGFVLPPPTDDEVQEAIGQMLGPLKGMWRYDGKRIECLIIIGGVLRRHRDDRRWWESPEMIGALATVILSPTSSNDTKIYAAVILKECCQTQTVSRLFDAECAVGGEVPLLIDPTTHECLVDLPDTGSDGICRLSDVLAMVCALPETSQYFVRIVDEINERNRQNDPWYNSLRCFWTTTCVQLCLAVAESEAEAESEAAVVGSGKAGAEAMTDAEAET